MDHWTTVKNRKNNSKNTAESKNKAKNERVGFDVDFVHTMSNGKNDKIEIVAAGKNSSKSVNGKYVILPRKNDTSSKRHTDSSNYTNHYGDRDRNVDVKRKVLVNREKLKGDSSSFLINDSKESKHNMLRESTNLKGTKIVSLQKKDISKKKNNENTKNEPKKKKLDQRHLSWLFLMYSKKPV